MKKRSNGSPIMKRKRKRKSFNRSPIPKHGSKKKRAHSDSYDPPPMISTPLVTSTSSAMMSTPLAAVCTPPVTSTPAASTPPVTFIPFPLLSYSSPLPIPALFSSASATGPLCRSSSQLQEGAGFYQEYVVYRVWEKVSMEPRHEGPIWTAWEKQASTRYKDLMYDVKMDGFQPDWITTAQYSKPCADWYSDPCKKK
ncbi:hypothetical protein M9H77_31223 [Catharanthus roseus]|uniref:Uncharacterized protein n=1 Tax=Catharanthus roseus TaxID=4058 RepID=A0ACC0A0F5_CATRO|nr:hypothetical protein M9H77_31223 [Catharanthus roseus]